MNWLSLGRSRDNSADSSSLPCERPSVWIFNHYAGWPETVPAVRTYQLARELAERGWSVTVIACSFNHYTFADDWPEISEKVWETEREGVRWVFVKGTGYVGNGVLRFRNMFDYVWQARAWALARQAPDVVIGTTVHPFAAEMARKFARRKRVRFCYEVTDLWPETLVDLGAVTRRSLIYRWMSRLERRCLTDADGVIGLLPRIPQYARDKHAVELPRFCYVPNGMTLKSADPADTIPEKGAIAWAGGFAKAHDMASILRAAGRLEQEHPGRFTFHLYGDGPERRFLEELARKDRVSNVVFHGLVSKQELRHRLLHAQICLCTGQSMPVHRYGISFNKIFDYFEAGRPVVFAVDAGNDPVAEAEAGLSVPAGDDAAIAEAIVQLADAGRSELLRLGENGRRFLERQHDFEILGNRLDGFLLEIRSLPPRTTAVEV